MIKLYVLYTTVYLPLQVQVVVTVVNICFSTIASLTNYRKNEEKKKNEEKLKNNL